MNAKISVILITYNGSTRGFIEEAIQSVLAQSFKDFELLIVDDGSKDDTKNICSRYLTDNRVKYFYQENKGPSSARNLGIRKSLGNLICFLDDDDYYHANRLEVGINYIENHPDKKTGMVYSNIYLVNKDGKIFGEQCNSANGNIMNELLFNNIIDGICSVTIKKEVFDKVGLFDELYKNDEDTELWFRIAKYYNIYSVNKKLAYVRFHMNNRLSDDIKPSQYYRLLTYFKIMTENYDQLQHLEDKIFNGLYYKIAWNYYRHKQFSDYRKYIKIASIYGGIKLIEWVKYSFSYLNITLTREPFSN